MAHILLIDDDNPLRDMLKLVLEREGYTVSAVGNAEDAQQTYRNYPPDLVVTDIVMPEKNGISVIMDLRREFADVRIIAMSGGDRVAPENYLCLAKSLGAVETLAKPFEMETLLNAITRALGNEVASA